MAELPAKAESVDAEGHPDGFEPPAAYGAQVLPGGITRLVISVPPARLAEVHRRLVAVLQPPLKTLYVQLTDRRTGQLPRPRHLVAVELDQARVLDALEQHARLLYHDGRHQLWVHGARDEQVVLEETGVIYAYPDDFAYREVLAECGIDDNDAPTMADRDYVKVRFLPEADAEEASLVSSLGLVRWDR